MDTYRVWFNLKDTSRDLEFCESLDEFLSDLKDRGMIEEFRLQRQKLGFGPTELGEFTLDIEIQDLAQLQNAFDHIAPREGLTEDRHRAVWSKVTDFRAALYRDFPDPVRLSGA